MAKERKIRLRRGLGYKMTLYVFFGILVIFTLVFHYTLMITRKIVVNNLKSNAKYITTNTVSKIEKVLSSIQRVPDNFAQIFQENEFDEAKMKQLLRMMVENNKEITGACLAFEPFFKNRNEKYHSFYYYRTNDTIKFLNLGNDQYVYFYMDWYQIPKELGLSLIHI